ncbi:hypothetical protein F5888DRAFT_1907770 [Russula emetica]|nr:hypothetical protein F5888DRAFT_1907770 [Russula emetica]
MAAKLLSLYLLTVAGLGLVRAVPVILNQRQDNPNSVLSPLPTSVTSTINPNGTLAQQPESSTIFSTAFTTITTNVSTAVATSVAVKRAAPLILNQRQDNPNGALSPLPTSVTSAINPNATLAQQSSSVTSIITLNGTLAQQSSSITSTIILNGTPAQQPSTIFTPLILNQRQDPNGENPGSQLSTITSTAFTTTTATSCATSSINPNGTLSQQPNCVTSTINPIDTLGPGQQPTPVNRRGLL